MSCSSKPTRKILAHIAPLILLLSSFSLYAQQPMAIMLKGSAVIPAVETSATGSGQISVLPDHTVSGSVKTSGLVPTMVHIHEATFGQNGPPIITLTKTAADSFAVPADARLTEAQYARFKAGDLYVNVHSARHPNGEIRGQLLHLAIADTPLRPAD